MRFFPCLWKARPPRPWRLPEELPSEFERQLYVRDLRATGAIPSVR